MNRPNTKLSLKGPPAFIQVPPSDIRLGNQSTGVTLEDILVLVKGLHRPPATGWEDTPQISFYRDPDRLSFASTCSLVLNISHGVETCERSKEKMTTAVLCGYGFGNV